MSTIEITKVTDSYLTNVDGDLIFNKIIEDFEKNNQITVSFKGISGINSSFVNSAFIQLLDEYDFRYIKRNLSFIDSNRQINNLIKSRFSFETNGAKN